MKAEDMLLGFSIGLMAMALLCILRAAPDWDGDYSDDPWFRHDD